MSDEGKTYTVEELQKQILEMKEASEKNAAEMQQLKDQLNKSAEDLKNARDLNAKLMSKVPGEGAPDTEKQPEDPYEGLSQEEMLARMGEDLVDKVVAELDAKNKKRRSWQQTQMHSGQRDSTPYSRISTQITQPPSRR